ncbi:hypothetical protein [Flavobacterium sp. NKUCC04_CG]|uniref:hypothetical protein n=1 Tax=Flavobacterium sp. NKUCC04_CG TaxID=2842121 RepID=UPI001C5A84C5|nr:hypothetical protein [Flavobacterium sp. NKUCC04_CG]MBW3519513.1 hypothetical protein [Flavobacterium sp. NKUCC04_CG]
MKHCIIMCFMATLFSFSSYAQEVIYAITTTGDRVVLKPDQTWYYADKGEKKTEESKPLPSTTPSTTRSNFTSTSSKTTPTAKKRSSSSRSYTRGPRGGCYYISASGKKVYVDRSLCN